LDRTWSYVYDTGFATNPITLSLYVEMSTCCGPLIEFSRKSFTESRRWPW